MFVRTVGMILSAIVVVASVFVLGQICVATVAFQQASEAMLSCLSTLGYLVAALVVWFGFLYTRRFMKRLMYVEPNEEGLFPVVRFRHGQTTVLHDPNRQLAGSVLYRTDNAGEPVPEFVLPPGDPEAQERIARNAALVQFASAATPRRLPPTTVLAGYSGFLGLRDRLFGRAGDQLMHPQAPGPPQPSPVSVVIPPVGSFQPSLPEDSLAQTAIQSQWEQEDGKAFTGTS